MLRSIIASVVVSLALVTSAHAQTQDQASKLSDYLGRTGQELDTAGMNLLHMATGMQSPEMDHISMIEGASRNCSSYIDKLGEVTFIYSILLDKRDQAAVKKRVVLFAKQSVRSCEVSIEQFNRALGKLRSPAALAEAQKTRDLMQKIRDEIQRTVPGS